MNRDRAERWASLLSSARLAEQRKETVQMPGRSEFDRDYDRVVFSSPFRRLQDKTQVFPLSSSDYTRTRLTHSIEVSCVGRSLGQLAGKHLQDLDLLPSSLSYADVGTIVAAACLGHDIGNPPFGHSGEDAIRHWASEFFQQNNEKIQSISTQERQDLLSFEGNAQSFRIFARLYGRERAGGLRLTLATIGAMTKYPCPAAMDTKERPKECWLKKWGYFQDDSDLAIQAFDALGLIKSSDGVYVRHPLAYLMEAADDICYAVVDIEDAYHQRILSFDTIWDYLSPIAKAKDKGRYGEQSLLSILRAGAISNLTMSCHQVFMDYLDDIESGKFPTSLIEATDLSDPYSALKKLARERVYTDSRVLQIEYAGYQAIGGLLEMYAGAMMADCPDRKDSKLRTLFPQHYLIFPDTAPLTEGDRLDHLSAYQRLLTVTDYICGMTDTYAIDLYQKLSGIKLPS